jgi:hypothetical protein
MRTGNKSDGSHKGCRLGRITMTVLLGLSVLSFSAFGRTWTSTSGSKIEAEFVELRHGTVVLQKSDGKSVRIAMNRLSKPDRQYIKDMNQGNRPVTSSIDAEGNPVVGPGFVGGPEFDTQSGTFSAGTAFFVSLPDKTDAWLITAHHIFGPPGGLPQEVSREDMRSFVKKVTIHDFVKGKKVSGKVDPLHIPSSGPDLAVFRTTLGAKVAPRPLAENNPKQGDQIWLVASLQGQPDDQILHRGVVTDVSPNKLKCKFDNGNLITRGASGAPYINAKGEVVGLHTGSYKEPGNMAGAVLPVETIRAAIQAALMEE